MWGAQAIIYTVLLLGALVGRVLGGGFLADLVEVILSVVYLLLIFGNNYLGARRAQGSSISPLDVLCGIREPLRVLPTLIVGSLLTVIGFMLLILPGVYLLFCYVFAPILAYERGYGFWDALETSRRVVTQHFFSVVGVWIVLLGILLVSLVPLGLGLIWTVPFFTIAVGVMYRELFGTGQPTSVPAP